MRERSPRLGRVDEPTFREPVRPDGGSRPVTLSQAYLDMLQDVEDLPCNRPGGDKSWVLDLERRERDLLAGSKRLT